MVRCHANLESDHEAFTVACKRLLLEPDKIQAQAGLPLDNAPDAYITALLVPKGGAIVTDRAALEAIGIR